jgi:hypothetical protein
MPRCEPTGGRRSLTVEEARALIRASNGERLGALVVCGLALGLRPGELTGLLWSDLQLDGDRPLLSVSGSMKRRRDSSLYRGPVKRSKAGERTVALPAPSWSPRSSPTGPGRTTSAPKADAGTTRASCFARRSGHRSTPATSARCSPGSQREPGSRELSRTPSGTRPPRCSSIRGRDRSGRRPPRRRSEDALPPLPPLPPPGSARPRGGRRTDADVARRVGTRPRTLTYGDESRAATERNGSPSPWSGPGVPR